MYGVTRLDTCEDIALVSFKKIPLSLPLLAAIFEQFAQNSINIDMVSQTAPTGHNVSISFTCLGSDMVQVLAITNSLSESHPQLRPMVSSGNCKIQLFGEEMRSMPGVFARAIRRLSETAVEVQQVTTSEIDISLLVSAAHFDEAVTALSDAFGLD